MSVLNTFNNPEPERNYIISLECPEFTCLCPMTGQPDFAVFNIDYIPNKLCIELKSLKLYLWSYRNEGAYHEAVTNKILSDLASICNPRWMEVRGRFNVRGGITTTVTATHGNKPK
jgi:7-cyano-7-deazaguanine reductase